MEMKKLTLIFPDSIDVIDMKFYWRTEKGELIKSLLAIDAKKRKDGDEINCYKPVEESEET